MQRVGFWVLVVVVLSAFAGSALAQDNLLRNPGMEQGGDFGPYVGRGRGNLTIPAGWNFWATDSPREFEYQNRSDKIFAFPHNGVDPSPKGGKESLNISCGFVTCTHAVFQQVSVPENSNVRARAWAWLHTCNPPKDKDGKPKGKCGSAVESGALTRIGIDPNGGTDANDSDVVWSESKRPHDRWEELSVDATASGGTVTLFLYTTQTSPADLNNVYWDESRLEVGGGGGTSPNAATPVPTRPPEVAFVVPQEEREDGSIVHIVGAGDTVDSIAVAYGMTRQEILELNNIDDPRLIFVGQQLTIKEGEKRNNDDNDDSGGGNDGGSDSGDEEAPEATATPQPTSTPAPPAPVISADSGNVLPAIDPSASTSAVCVSMFDDNNQNRIQEEGESLIGGGSLTLNAGTEQIGMHETDGASEPHCFTDLSAGDYLAIAQPPSGYGLTSPDQLQVRALPGTTINIAFGVAQGVQPLVAPPADSGGIVSDITAQETDTQSLADTVLGISGFLVFGLAGLVLVAGIGAALLFRRQ